MTETAAATMTEQTFAELRLDSLVESDWNPRKHFDPVKLRELADSIREKGVIEPIVVRPRVGSLGLSYQIIAGARRFRAAKLVGLDGIPALIRDLDDIAALELAVIENGQRADIHPLDEAEGYQALLDADRKFTVAIVAAKVGKSESYVYRRLKLLSLETFWRQALACDQLSVAHAERLLRLSSAQREAGTDADSDLFRAVWSRSPLLDGSDADWTPTAEDLRPLADLEAFIRRHSAFHPASPDAKHFQPALVEQVESALLDDGVPVTPEAEAAVLASLIELSEDSLARVQLGAAKGDVIPLTPSKWREVRWHKDRCDFTTRGVVTHGGPPRVIDVCVTRRCAKHFPPAKAKTTKTVGTTSHAPARDYAAEEKERETARAAFQALMAAVYPAFAQHIAKMKFSAALVRASVDIWVIRKIEEQFGVKLTEATAAQVLALASVDTYSREAFINTTKPYKFDLAKFEKTYRAEQAVAAKASTKAQKRTTATKPKVRKPARPAKKKGGR